MDWKSVPGPLNICTVEGDNNVRHIISVENGKLVWCNDGWSLVRVLEGLSSNSCFPNNLVSVASLGRGGRVAVWWKKVELGRQGRHYTNQCKTDIWCAEISFEMRPCLLPPGLQLDELWGVVEWSKSVFTFDGCDSGYDFFLHSAIVTLWLIPFMHSLILVLCNFPPSFSCSFNHLLQLIHTYLLFLLTTQSMIYLILLFVFPLVYTKLHL